MSSPSIPVKKLFDIFGLFPSFCVVASVMLRNYMHSVMMLVIVFPNWLLHMPINQEAGHSEDSDLFHLRW